MGSTRQQDRLLGGGISLPQWMKGRGDARFDFDDSTFSPPSHDDSFFYIRYPKTQNQLSVSQDFRPIDEVFDTEEKIGSTSIAAANVQGKEERAEVTGEGSKRNDRQVIDFSKHPPACQPFVPASSVNKDTEIKGNPSKVSLIDGNARISKSQGIDDGFHGEPALCGKSIVLVASQMMSNKFHETFTAEQQQATGNRQLKRGSKSLPATPIASPAGSPNTSPKARRRVPSNRYFTGPFLPDREKYQSGWILASIFGQSREIVTAKIEEEDETNTDISAFPARTLNRKKSISSQNLTYVGPGEKQPDDKSAVQPTPLQAKPSELREMNCWSPTSM